MANDPEQITFFAKTDSRGSQVPFGIKAKDRTRHVYVIGKTGMGKSTLLENMAVQDIKNGNGLAFIDPHGQTAETLLNYIPAERKNDVLYFAPFDTDCPISFNVMEDVGPERRHLVVSGLMSVFKKIWVDAWSARMEYILSNTLLALLEYPDSTLLGVNRMLSDKAYRTLVVDNIKDPSVKSFWVDEFAKYNERYMQEAGDAIKNKIGQFTSNPLIRNIIGQAKSSFDIRQIMDERKILIMNLSKGLVGESNANLLGSMLTTRIYLAAMSRANLTHEQMEAAPNFYFYVDEFQSFANATFSNILSEARKYKLNLTIAHQYIEQMEEEVRNAVFGNVGTIVAFRVGPFDAEVLETIFSPKFLATDIVNLGFAQIYLTLMIDGIGSSPFSATTLPPIPRATISCYDMIVAESRRQFSRPRAEVEALVNKFHEPVTLPPGIRASNPPPSGARKKPPFGGGGSGGAGGGARRAPEAPATRPRTTNPASDGDGARYAPPRERSAPPADRRQSEDSAGFRPNRERRQNETSAPRPAPAARSEKHLSDLRSVLQSITKKHEPTAATERPASAASAGESTAGERPAPRPKKSAGTPDPGLKDALARALGNLDTETAVPTAARPPQSPRPPQRAPQAAEPARSAPTAAEATTYANEHTAPTPPPRQSPPPPRAETNALDPKKLERMMRVTGADRPPL